MSRLNLLAPKAQTHQLILAVLVFTVALSAVESASKKSSNPSVLPLPSYVPRACSRNDPNISECVKRVGIVALKNVVKGDPKYRIPKLDPILINELKVQQGTKQVGLSLICRQCHIYGIKDVDFNQVEIDWKKRVSTWGFHAEKIFVKGKYNVSGQVLLLPIYGNGDAEFNFNGVDFKYIYHWNEYKIANWTYVNVTEAQFPLEIKKLTMKLDNLFNGNKVLGENMNRFLNENWAEILKDIKPALSGALASLTTSVLENVARLVPFDLLFPKKYDPKAPLP
ncbi:Hypothetical protein NTJ_08420 [Nesidiocoris tenuis]|nr:Hypothetical protein NTJ_08420 [Nesidiocoris tenuis]